MKTDPFNYVQVLMNIIESEDQNECDKILIQIIDYSDRILYNSMKEE